MQSKHAGNHVAGIRDCSWADVICPCSMTSFSILWSVVTLELKAEAGVWLIFYSILIPTGWIWGWH